MPESKSQNKETVVKCPIDGCDHEGLSRGMHLHIRQSSGGGHGEHGDVPEHLDLSDLKVVGEEKVEMNYPEHRDVENVARLCPFCHRPFNGYQGVMIHLGQISGKEDHPKDAKDNVEKDDLPIASVDENRNVVEIIEGGDSNIMPSTESRRTGSISHADVQEFLSWLEDNDSKESAEKGREMLLS